MEYTEDEWVYRYIHTEQDKIEDITTFNEFEKKFNAMLDSVDFKMQFHSRDERHENFGVVNSYFNHFEYKEIRDSEKARVIPKITCCFITSNVWGIINKDKPIEELNRRNYKIDFSIRADVTEYRCRRTANGTSIKKFYDFSPNMDVLISQFKEYLECEVIPFINKYDFNIYFS